MKSEIRVETWQCQECGPNVPCVVEIAHFPTKYPHIESQPRFIGRKHGCICDEQLVAVWIQRPSVPLDGRPAAAGEDDD